MSRVGKQPVAIPDKVKATIQANKVTVEGPLGRLERTLNPGITCAKDETGKQLILTRAAETKPLRMLHGLERSLINNMVVGVTQGYKKDLEVNGIGYNVKIEGKFLTMELGFANTIKIEIPQGIKVEVTQATNPGRMSISGADKHDVGQFAAKVRAERPPEPYQGKGIKYTTETIRRKAGKAFVGAGG